MTENAKRHIFDDPKNVRRVRWTLYTLSGLAVIAELFVKRKDETWWEGLFGFYAVYGFAACVILVLVAKELRKVLMRGEDYYDG
jgi:hypothetical protein